MNSRVLSVLCCPSCRGELGVTDNRGQQGSVQDGTVECSQCGAEYPVVAGVLVLLSGEHGNSQEAERHQRDLLAQQYHGAGDAGLLARISRHHYVPSMNRAVRAFAERFSEHQWVLDIGAGWGWHWRGVDRPNIIAIDFSLESLLVARNLLGPQVDRNLHLVCADAAQLPVKERTVDGIWSVQTFQHLAESGLKQCLTFCSTALKSKAAVEVYWLNWNSLGLGIRKLLGRKVVKETANPYYLRYIAGGELRELFSTYFGGRITIGYSEVLFHPEVRMIHGLPLAWLDQGLGKVPFLSRLIARQVVARAVSS